MRFQLGLRACITSIICKLYRLEISILGAKSACDHPSQLTGPTTDQHSNTRVQHNLQIKSLTGRTLLPQLHAPIELCTCRSTVIHNTRSLRNFNQMRVAITKEIKPKYILLCFQDPTDVSAVGTLWPLDYFTRIAAFL